MAKTYPEQSTRQQLRGARRAQGGQGLRQSAGGAWEAIPETYSFISPPMTEGEVALIQAMADRVEEAHASHDPNVLPTYIGG